ncbi:HTH-type transcriptional regulator malR, putative [Ricinus communis]|uniref:HTH-type transcriptional regulator malR, putative n=1 Tax=Ricinus communis TaxID=3988 RepID=B9TC22_RICCO|nr:HTH-type transcriptional regulator malR, putative [Ricinus communis]
MVEEIALDRETDVAMLDAMLRTTRLDGVILSPPVTDHEPVLEKLKAQRIPFIRIAPLTNKHRSPQISADDSAGARAIARHLWGLGHRRIGFIAGPVGHSASHLRQQGFIDELMACGLDRKAVSLAEGDFSFASGMAAGILLLGKKPRVTAIFAANDDMAAGVIAAAARLGVRVPEDLSVAGFDDSPVATLVWPPITTVRQPIVEMAAAAAELLIGEGTAPAKPFGVELIERRSTGVSPEIVREPRDSARPARARKKAVQP